MDYNIPINIPSRIHIQNRVHLGDEHCSMCRLLLVTKCELQDENYVKLSNTSSSLCQLCAIALKDFIVNPYRMSIDKIYSFMRMRKSTANLMMKHCVLYRPNPEELEPSAILEVNDTAARVN